jgi:hypothetical protein
MKNETYDKAKLIATVFLPALAALIGTIGTAVSWTHTGVTVIVLSALETFFGAILGVSSANYAKAHGAEEVQDDSVQ